MIYLLKKIKNLKKNINDDYYLYNIDNNLDDLSSFIYNDFSYVPDINEEEVLEEYEIYLKKKNKENNKDNGVSENNYTNEKYKLLNDLKDILIELPLLK
jgi:hypothetical protein